MTRLVRFQEGESPESVTTAALERAFTSGPDGMALNNLGRFCALYGYEVTAMLLPEIPVARIDENTPIWSIPYRANGGCTAITTSLSNLKATIRQHSGGPVFVGAKGLTYGTSAIECALSKSDSAYPGDVDAVIVDDKGVIRCVVEYKKHNLSDPLGNHLIDRYYPTPDGRKYRRLDALVADYRRTTAVIPFVVFYYSTKSEVIRVQQIDQLLPNEVKISRDTDDMMIAGMNKHQVAAKIVNWLGIP